MSRRYELTTQATVLAGIALVCLTMLLSVLVVAGEGDTAAAIVLTLIFVVGWFAW